MKFSGESFPENVIKCYGEVSAWLNRYLGTSFGEFTFDFEMIYFNSSTLKVLTNIFSMLNEAAKENHVIVNWCCSEDNDIMMEYGEEFKQVEKAPANIKELEAWIGENLDTALPIIEGFKDVTIEKVDGISYKPIETPQPTTPTNPKTKTNGVWFN